MKLAFFSPLNPQRSGIGDYSEALLPHLAERAEIDLFVDGFAPTNEAITSRFRVFDYKHEPQVLERLQSYDATIYHIGNDHRYHSGIYDVAQKFPGILVLHDFALQHFFYGRAQTERRMEFYLAELEACAGRRVRREAEEAIARGATPPHTANPVAYPLNCRLANSAEAIIVHSEWSRARLEKIAPAVPIKKIPHLLFFSEDEAQLSRQNNPRNRVVEIASFGLITPDKGIERALRALARLRARYDFHYTLVGEPNAYFDIRAVVRELRLQDRVTVTGHVSIEEFARRIARTDIAINLRERTVGETSGSLCRIMAAGVASIVSNAGWFAEIPSDCVVKVEMDARADALIEAYLARLIEDENLRAQLGANARRYVFTHHRIETSAAQYLSFIDETIRGRARRRLITGVSNEMGRLGIERTDEKFLQSVAREIVAIAPEKIFSQADGDSKHPPLSCAGEFQKAIEDDARDKPEALSHDEIKTNARLPKLEGLNYEQGALEYVRRLDAERRHYLYTKPFYNLANKPPKHEGEGMDAETHRHFCDFANMAVALALPAGSRILDVGCGSGWLAEFFARMGYDVTGVDISPELIEMARERVARVPYQVDHETPLRCRFLVHNIERGALGETFDAVICYDSLHHFVDERAVMQNLARMTKMNGALFILEGDKPPDESPTAEELRGVMRKFATLESPFHPRYLRALVDEYGFAVIGDYVSVNGLFERGRFADGNRLAAQFEPVNYLLCKKVVEGASASTVKDSRAPARLAVRLTLDKEARVKTNDGEFRGWQTSVAAGEIFYVPLEIENTGDTLWRAGREAQRGTVMIGVKIFDAQGALISETHGEPPLPRAIAPGERARVVLKPCAPRARGTYRLKIDLVNQHICWFESCGSTPLVLEFEAI